MSLLGMTPGSHPRYTRPVDDEVDDRATHPLDFADWQERFGFTVDVAASAANAKLPRYYDRGTNGLEQPWAGEMVWCNPPFSDIAPWLRKAWAEWPAPRGIVMLLPANRTEQAWWQELVEPFRDRPSSPLRTEFVRGRLRFLRPGQTAVGPGERPPFGVCLLIWEQPMSYAGVVTGGLFPS